MCAYIAAQLLLTYPKKPSVFAPEDYFDAGAFFAEAEKRKFRVTKSVEFLE